MARLSGIDNERRFGREIGIDSAAVDGLARVDAGPKRTRAPELTSVFQFAVGSSM